MSDLHSETADRLFDAILALKDREECYRFFEDLCTITELQAMSQRFHVARLLRRAWCITKSGGCPGPAAPPSAASTAASSTGRGAIP